MFNPIQFIVNYDSQKFSLINFLDTGSMYMDGRTTFFFLPLGLNIITIVLSIFRDNLLAFNHSIILLNSLLTTSDNSCKFFEL